VSLGRSACVLGQVGILFVNKTESSKRKDRTAEMKKRDAAQAVHEAAVRSASMSFREIGACLWREG
jgi:hypothetical protein